MKNVNLKHNNTMLNHDVTNALIDTVLEQTNSIMFTRQATYYFIMKLNGYNSKIMQKEVKFRAKQAKVDFNRGVLSREVRVAEYAILNLHHLFANVKLEKKDFHKVICEIASIMNNNDIKYNTLKDKLVEKKEESEEKIPQESENAGDSQESKSITSLEAVIDFIENTTQENRLKLADILANAIRENAGDSQESSEEEAI